MVLNIAVIEKYSRFLNKLKEEIRDIDCRFIHIEDIENFDAEEIKDVNIIFGSKVNRELLKCMPKLKLIQVFGAGIKRGLLDVVKDFPHIIVANTHGNKEAVAEHAIALLLAVTKNITRYDHLFRKGRWTLPGNEYNTLIYGKIVGILGLGSVGKEIAKRIKSFGVKIYAIKRTKDDKLKQELGLDFLGDSNDIDFVLKSSDFVFVALPRTKETEGLLSREKLSLMKPTSILINISRGDIIDEGALYEVLRDKKIKGAGLDVWYEYPKNPEKDIKYPSKYPFHQLENVVMTPHVAWKTPESEYFQIQQVVENIRRVAKGLPLINVVNIELGY